MIIKCEGPLFDTICDPSWSLKIMPFCWHVVYWALTLSTLSLTSKVSHRVESLTYWPNFKFVSGTIYTLMHLSGRQSVDLDLVTLTLTFQLFKFTAHYILYRIIPSNLKIVCSFVYHVRRISFLSFVKYRDLELTFDDLPQIAQRLVHVMRHQYVQLMAIFPHLLS